MTGLVLVALAAAALLNAGLWWLVDRPKTLKIASLNVKLGVAMGNAFRLTGRVSELEAENESLRDRNEFLVGLVGADTERAALHGSSADEAGWGR